MKFFLDIYIAVLYNTYITKCDTLYCNTNEMWQMRRYVWESVYALAKE